MSPDDDRDEHVPVWLRNGGETPEDRQQRERHGVSGDPTPDHEYGDVGGSPHPDVEPPQRDDATVQYMATRIADKTPLSERQAHAWLLRDVEGLNPEDTADRMQITESTMYGHLSQARKKIRAADRLLSYVDDLSE